VNIIQFGDELFRTQDLDPVYVAIHAAKLTEKMKAKLSLAYWCFYHLGVAARIAEAKTSKAYWGLMQTAAKNPRHQWPRGTERRHFRGQQSIDAVRELRKKYSSAEEAVETWCGHNFCTFQKVSVSVQTSRGFGPWISFKIADMAERVLGYDVSFSDCELGIYKDPRKGAALALSGDQNYPITDEELKKTVDKYVNHWAGRKKIKAPPVGNRLVNVQEIETVFCKYKSHINGHYPMGKDIQEVHHGLTGWGDLAQQLQKGLPKWPN